MVRRQVAVNSISECAALHRSNAEHAGTRYFARRDDLPGAARPGEILELTRRVERIRDALHRGRTGLLLQRCQDAFRNPDAGNTPSSDAPVGNESLADWNEALDVGSPACCWTIGVGTCIVAVRNDV